MALKTQFAMLLMTIPGGLTSGKPVCEPGFVMRQIHPPNWHSSMALRKAVYPTLTMTFLALCYCISTRIT